MLFGELHGLVRVFLIVWEVLVVRQGPDSLQLDHDKAVELVQSHLVLAARDHQLDHTLDVAFLSDVGEKLGCLVLVLFVGVISVLD
jgi:hypothetical protein